jgi:hypothetical protein
VTTLSIPIQHSLGIHREIRQKIEKKGIKIGKKKKLKYPIVR